MAACLLGFKLGLVLTESDKQSFVELPDLRSRKPYYEFELYTQNKVMLLHLPAVIYSNNTSRISKYLCRRF